MKVAGVEDTRLPRFGDELPAKLRRGLRDRRRAPRCSYAILDVARGRVVPRLVLFDRPAAPRRRGDSR